jgi:hypothetical protein
LRVLAAPPRLHLRRQQQQQLAGMPRGTRMRRQAAVAQLGPCSLTRPRRTPLGQRSLRRQRARARTHTGPHTARLPLARRLPSPARTCPDRSRTKAGLAALAVLARAEVLLPAG